MIYKEKKNNNMSSYFEPMKIRLKINKQNLSNNIAQMNLFLVKITKITF